MVEKIACKWMLELFRLRQDRYEAECTLRAQNRLVAPTKDTELEIAGLEAQEELLEQVIKDLVEAT